jgi:hypothetical protein
MELIGKKVVRKTAFETSNEPKVTVVLKKATARLGFTGAVMRKINLFGKEIGVAYDNGKAYLYVTPEGEGNKVKDNGSCNTRYHAQRLVTEFKLGEDGGELMVDTNPTTFAEFEGVNFYELTKTSEVPEVEDLPTDTTASEVAEQLDDLETESYFPENNVVDTDSLQETTMHNN